MSVWEGNAKIILILCAFLTLSRCQPHPCSALHFICTLCLGASPSPGTSRVSKSVFCEERTDLVISLVNMGSSRKPFPLAQGIGYRKMDKGLQVGGFLCRSWRTKCWGILESSSLLGGVEEDPFCLHPSWIKNPKPKPIQPPPTTKIPIFI